MWTGSRGVETEGGKPSPAGRAGAWLAALALFLLPASVLTLPANLLPFGLVLLLSSLPVLPALVRAWPGGRGGRLLLLAAPGVVLMAALSAAWHGRGLDALDNISRLLVIPWLVCWMRVWRPSPHWLGRGAVTGLLGCAVLALWQCLAGEARAGGWANAIVLADGAVMLLVLVLACRRPGDGPLQDGVAALACVAVLLLTASRGAWLAAGLVAAAVLLGGAFRQAPRRRRRALLAGLAGVALLLASPGLREQVRVEELAGDIARLGQGDADSSLGARLRLWQATAETVSRSPWTGTGVGGVAAMVSRLPECTGPERPRQLCGLRHAHNDLAHWAASGGVPGILALLLVYGVPLGLFLRWRRHPGNGPQARLVATGGALLVAVQAACGLTQSMFSHQLTAGLYAVLVGLLLGAAWPPGAADRPAAARVPAARA